jgi:hypothetical protein
MITFNGTFKARESNDQTRRQSISGLHSQAENALSGSVRLMPLLAKTYSALHQVL